MRKSRNQQTSAPASNTPAESPESREAATARTENPVGTAPQSVGDTTASAPDRERIAIRAYELYLERGGGDGSALDDWLTAEREFHSRRTE